MVAKGLRPPILPAPSAIKMWSVQILHSAASCEIRVSRSPMLVAPRHSDCRNCKQIPHPFHPECGIDPVPELSLQPQMCNRTYCASFGPETIRSEAITLQTCYLPLRRMGSLLNPSMSIRMVHKQQNRTNLVQTLRQSPCQIRVCPKLY